MSREQQHAQRVPLGLGGWGCGARDQVRGVVRCRQYAIKKIPLDAHSPHAYARIMREVTTLSRLQHPNVVRYYQVGLWWCFRKARTGVVLTLTQYSYQPYMMHTPAPLWPVFSPASSNPHREGCSAEMRPYSSMGGFKGGRGEGEASGDVLS